MARLRIIIGSLAAAALLAGGAYIVTEQSRSCGFLDIRLSRSGCVAAHDFPGLFDGANLNRPAMAFEGGSGHLAMAMVETRPASAGRAVPQRYSLLEVEAETGAIQRQTPAGDFAEGRLNGAVLLSWDGRYAAVAVPQPKSPDNPPTKDWVLASLKLMPLVEGETGWDKPMGEIPESRSGFGHFDPDNRRFRLFTGAWSVTGETLDRGQVNWNKAFGASNMPVNTPDGTTAIVRTSEGIIEIVQADGRRSSHELGVTARPMSTNWLLLSPNGRKLALILRPAGEDGILQVWDIGTGTRLLDTPVPGLRSEAAWSADGRYLAVRRDGRGGSGYALFAVKN